MMLKYDIIVIGGGLGGLTAGATLAKKGKKVLLLEQHYIPGGCATTFKRKDYVMEVGLHEMDGLFEKDAKQDIFRFLGVDKNIEFIQIPELFRLKGKNIDFVHPHGYEASIKSLTSKYPKEEKAIKQFLKIMDGILTEVPKFPVARWKQILLMPIMPLVFPNIVKFAKVSVGNWLDKNVKDEELKLVLTAMLLYYHDNPHTMSMIYFAVAQSSYIQGGGHFIKGGSQQLSNYLTSVIEEHGGQVLLGKIAEEIVVENGRANGVIFGDTFNASAPKITAKAQAIIANAAIPLVKKLLPPKERKKLARKIDHLEPACALLSIYIGFKKELKALGNKHYSTFILGDGVESLHDVKQNNHSNWSNRNFVFVDYSQIDAGLTPQGKSFGVVCTADYLSDWEELDTATYQAKKEAVAQAIFNRIEDVIPGFKEQIEYYEVGTSKTVQRYTMNPGGTAYGFAQTPKQSGMGRVPFKSPVKGLYFAGAWTFPGGGFTGAIISGYSSANVVNDTLKSTPVAKPTLLNRNLLLVAKKEVANNTVELTIEKPKDFDFESGQYAVLEVVNPKYMEIDMPIRPLSFVSHPNENTLRFAMRYSESSFKKSIAESDIGDTFRVYGPMGDFTLDTNTSRGIVYLISGIGITPILPFIQELKERKFTHPIHLFYSNKTLADTSYHDVFKCVEGLDFNYHPVFTSTQDRIGVDLIKKQLNNTSNFDYYIVGTGGFVEGMQDLLSNLDVPTHQVKVDDFG